MMIGGLQKFSLIDYPGKISAIIFTIGCNFRCSYCYNQDLVIPSKFRKDIPIDEIYDFLESRKGKLDAICITGGEPTLHNDLTEFIRNIKKMGFLVKLDSNGTRPEVLENLIQENLVDYFAMDIKAPFSKYRDVVNYSLNTDNIKKSIDIIMNSGIDYEFRTTIEKSMLTENDIFEIVDQIIGAKKYYLQMFRNTDPNNSEFNKFSSYSKLELENLILKFKDKLEFCQVR